MPRALFCLYSRNDDNAEKKLQEWQRAYSRRGWETTVLSHQHGPGFVHEIRLGRPRWWPWLAWRLHGARQVAEEIAKQSDFAVLWCGFPARLLQSIRSDRRLTIPQSRQKIAFGRWATGDARPPHVSCPKKESLGKTALRQASPRLEKGVIYDLRIGGEKNPYHWLMHAIVPLELCRRPADLRVLLNPDPSPMQVGSLRMMGIKPGQILTHLPRRDVRTLPARSVKLAEAVRILRKTFGNRPARPARPESIYISRLDAQYRRLLDEPRLASLPPGIRPRLVVMSEKPWEEQLEIFQKSRVVCGVHGAAFVYIVFCPPGSKLIEMFPGGYERNHFRHLAEICGLQWERIDGEPIGRQGRRCREADLRLGDRGLQHLRICLESSSL